MDLKKAGAGFFLFLFAAAAIYFFSLSGPDVEKVSEPNPNAEILNVTKDGWTHQEIRYTWRGERFQGLFLRDLKPSLEWLLENTPEDSKITAWWDYGDAIRGYARRSVFTVAPSRKALEETVVDGEPDHDFITEEKMKELAEIYTSKPSKARRLMDQYDSQYLYITKWEVGKYSAITKVVNDYSGYSVLHRVSPTETGVSNDNGVSEYRSNNLKILLERSKNGSLSSAPVVLTRYKRLRVKYYCSSEGLVEFDANHKGCFGFLPDSKDAVYVPADQKDSLFVRLYVMNGSGVEDFKKVYHDKDVQIWKLEE